MSGETSQAEPDRDVDLKVVSQCYTQIEAAILKGVQKGVFSLGEAHLLYECCLGFAETIKRCDVLQKKLGHFMRQQEMLQQTSVPVPPSQ